MLLNTTCSTKTLRTYTSGGHHDSNKHGDLPGSVRVWLNPSSMLNILSFKDARKRFQVIIDTMLKNAICVYTLDGSILNFKEVELGLYLLSSSNSFTKKNARTTSYLTLVKANKNNFTKIQLKRAGIANEIRKTFGYSGYRKYFKLIETHFFRNCPITVEDAKRALHIYGLDIESLKGKITKHTPMAI